MNAIRALPCRSGGGGWRTPTASGASMLAASRSCCGTWCSANTLSTAAWWALVCTSASRVWSTVSKPVSVVSVSTASTLPSRRAVSAWAGSGNVCTRTVTLPIAPSEDASCAIATSAGPPTTPRSNAGAAPNPPPAFASTNTEITPMFSNVEIRKLRSRSRTQKSRTATSRQEPRSAALTTPPRGTTPPERAARVRRQRRRPLRGRRRAHVADRSSVQAPARRLRHRAGAASPRG